jgi:uncharacterized protein YegP (UPF0339 family)
VVPTGNGPVRRPPNEGVIMAGKYEVYKDKSGGFRFRLKAANGEVIASSESYKTKASALNGIESVKKNAASDTVDLTEES